MLRHRCSVVLAALLGAVLGLSMRLGSLQAFVGCLLAVPRGAPHLRSASPHLAAHSSSPSLVSRQAEADPFDPFGWKGALKEGVLGIKDALKDEQPSEVEEKMISEIFDKFDVDKDKVLNLEEFNKLQVATEGEEACYNLDQLKQLLVAVNPDIEQPERGMPFEDYRRLYVERRLRELYETDVARDHIKVFGAGAQPVASTPAPSSSSDSNSDLAEGRAVIVEGLSGAVELNGQVGKIVSASETEQEMIAEGRVIVLLDNGERLALKPANVKPKPSVSVE